MKTHILSPIFLVLATALFTTLGAEEPTPSKYLIPLSLGECGDITFKPGIRIQPSYLYDQEEGDNDFFIRRFRLKASGDAFGLAIYGLELKIDGTGKHGADPEAKVENAWVDFFIREPFAYLRVGLYDLPFSRNALTSDSKLLFINRSLIKNELTRLGLADNTIGVMLHGRPFCGHVEYAVGVFDNEKFEVFDDDDDHGLESDQLMVAGRVVFNFFEPMSPPIGYADYYGSYICNGHRFALGFNAAYLGGAEDEDETFDLYAFGADLFYNYRRFTFQAEFDWFHEDTEGWGWYVQAGYLVFGPIELAARYQELEPTRDDDHGRLQWTSLGINFYIRQHNLKIQTDYTFKHEQKSKTNNNVYQIQLQLDY